MRLFVANLPFDASRRELFDLFGRYGRITHLELPLDPVTRRPLGLASSSFTTARTRDVPRASWRDSSSGAA
jgi:RNA recognition motif-containing protein